MIESSYVGYLFSKINNTFIYYTCITDGKKGLYPIIPPDVELCFDITLIAFKPRPVWIKKLIQEPGLCEKPYYVDPHTDKWIQFGADS